MKARELRLTPSEPYLMPDAKTIGLSGGEFPFVIIQLAGGKTIKLHVGQTLPVAHGYSLINPFQRTGNIEVVFDTPVNLEFSTKLGIVDQQSSAVTYMGGVSTLYAGDNLYPVISLYQKTGRAFVEILKGELSNYKIYIAYDVADNWQAVADTYLGGVAEILHHNSGAGNDRTITASGKGSTADILNLSNDMGVVQVAPTCDFSLILPEGSALFIVGLVNNDVNVALRVVDYGGE